MRTSLHGGGRLAGLGALRDPGSGRTAAWIAGLLLLLLVAVALLIASAVQERAAAAEDLDNLVLAGPRNLTCQRVVILLDVSGSMTEYASVREDAMSNLAVWAPANLRADDELAVVRWADTAAIDAGPTDADSLTASTFTAGSEDVGGGTEILPSIEAVASMPRSSCRTSLVFISDGELSTAADQSRLDEAIREGEIDRVSLVLPNGGTTPEYWMQVFPYSQTFYADPDDPTQTARALGQAIAAATGQQLELRP